jgi:hypothetical protein
VLRFFLNGVQIDGAFFLATTQTLKSGACGGPFFKDSFHFFLSSRRLLYLQKKR